MADDGRRPRVDFQRAGRPDVGDGDSASRRRSRRPADRQRRHSLIRSRTAGSFGTRQTLMRNLFMASIVAASVRRRRAEPVPRPNVDQLKANDRAICRRSICQPMSRKLPANERQALAQARRSGQGDGHAVPAPGLGRQRDHAPRVCCRIRRELGRARQHYFLLNKGPWSRLDHDEPFIPGAPAKPEQANFYPADATKERGRGMDLDALGCADGRSRPGSTRQSGATPRASSSRCPTASNTRASWRTPRRC